MTSIRTAAAVWLAVAVSGCGSPMAGNYAAHARITERTTGTYTAYGIEEYYQRVAD